MIRIILVMLYLGVGFGVVTSEATDRPWIAEEGKLLWSVAFWPVFPVQRLYMGWMNVSN